MKFIFVTTYTVIKTNRKFTENQPDLESSEIASEAKRMIDRANSGEIKLTNFAVVPMPDSTATPIVVPKPAKK